MNSAIYNTRTNREVIKVRFCKNILSFFLPETILKLQNQSIKLAPLSLSFSSKSHKLEVDVLLADKI
jgi:predicted nucleotidyltransferase